MVFILVKQVEAQASTARGGGGELPTIKTTLLKSQNLAEV